MIQTLICPNCQSEVPYNVAQLLSGKSFNCPTCKAAIKMSGSPQDDENRSFVKSEQPKPPAPVIQNEPTELEMLLQDERLMVEEIEYTKKHLKTLEQILANTRRRIEIEKKR